MSLAFDEDIVTGHQFISEALGKLDLARARLSAAAGCPDHGARAAQIAVEKIAQARATLMAAQTVLSSEVQEIELIGLGY